MTHELTTQTAPDLDDLWARYRKLAPFGLPGSGLGDVREELRTALLKSADRTLNAYRGDAPVSTVKGWQKAHDHLQAAVDLNYRDRPTGGRRCSTPRGTSTASRRRSRARAISRTTRSRRPATPSTNSRTRRSSPRTGRTPSSGSPTSMPTSSRTWRRSPEASINEAERRGYAPGPPREGHARRRLPDAGGADPGPGPCGGKGIGPGDWFLVRSRDAFTQSIGLYRDAGNFADAKGNMATAAQELRSILDRLEEGLGVWVRPSPPNPLSQPPSLPPGEGEKGVPWP